MINDADNFVITFFHDKMQLNDGLFNLSISVVKDLWNLCFFVLFIYLNYFSLCNEDVAGHSCVTGGSQFTLTESQLLQGSHLIKVSGTYLLLFVCSSYNRFPNTGREGILPSMGKHTAAAGGTRIGKTD